MNVAKGAMIAQLGNSEALISNVAVSAKKRWQANQVQDLDSFFKN